MMVTASNSAQRQTTSSTSTTSDDTFSSASKLVKELEQNIDVLLLDQDVRQSNHTRDQSPGRDNFDARGTRFS